MSNPSITAAAHVLTEMAMRPDLSATLTDEELQIRADYERLRALEQRRQALRFELESCRTMVSKVEEGLSARVRSARYTLRQRAQSVFSLGRAA